MHAKLKRITMFFRDQLSKISFLDVQTLPEYPIQDSDDAILSFFVSLTRGAVIPKHILGTIFIKQQETILTLESTVEDLREIFAGGVRVNLTDQQRMNEVLISLVNVSFAKVSYFII